jgi:hypothetical protein
MITSTNSMVSAAFLRARLMWPGNHWMDIRWE